MKIFGKKTVDLFLISFLVPEILVLKECKMAPKVVHQNMAYCRNFGENGEICDVNRFACQ